MGLEGNTERSRGKFLMDKLDIFLLDPDTKVMTTVAELRKLYMMGFEAGDRDDADGDTLIAGEIV